MNTDLLDPEVNQLLAKRQPDETRNARRAAMYLATVSDMVVDTQTDYDQAADELRAVKQAWSDMETDRTSFTVPLNSLLDRLNARFQPYLKTLKSAESILKTKMGGFLAREERRIAEARADAERIATAERQRAQTQAAALREEADTAALDGVRQAAHQQADALEQAAAVAIAQPVAQVMPRVDGISTLKTIAFELEDLFALVSFIATDRPDLVVLLKLDEPRVRAHVKVHGVKTGLPGLRVFEKHGITVR